MNARTVDSLATFRCLFLGLLEWIDSLTARGTLRMAGSAMVLLSLSACLLDLEGGPGRVQVRATGTDTLVALSIAAWRHDFVPSLAPGKTSETIELPVSGRLTVSLWGQREGRDTVLTTRTIQVGVGEFVRLE